ncbi:MAG: HNH endonuclease signature motif containing protein [Paracoccaceae bacterium]|nr:HNH endonuclease signature motif containing protein [Paracoccaceae bacterium]
MSDLFINTFTEIRTCTYKDDTYDVRDNGAILRRRRLSGRHRKLDNYWTFGTKNEKTGYANFGSDPVHRIVATAFHGDPPTKQHIVDHIDTNRMNNRPENLRWITKLENMLLNPITLKRIVEAYGSVEQFFADPSRPKNQPLPGQFNWMRTVSRDEAAASRTKLESWANSSKKSSGGSLGEWLFEHRNQVDPPKLPEITKALTDGALQANWVTPSEFPLCPKAGEGGSLSEYASALRFGETFSKNEYGRSFIVEGGHDFRSNCLVVVCRIENAPINNWGITTIYLHEGNFIHENKGTYLTLVEAVEIYAAGTGDSFSPDAFEPNLGPSYGT